MRFSVLLAVITGLNFSAFAGNKNDKKPAERTILVECTATVKGVREKITLRMNNRKEIVYFRDNHVAQASKKGIFWMLAEDVEKSGVEAVRTFFTPNRYSVVYAVTTADSVKVGVSLNLNAGFYEYSDLGSGNGNQRYSMTCQQK